MKKHEAGSQSLSIIGILILVLCTTLLLVGVVLLLNRPPPAEAIVATLAALPSPTMPPTPTPTPAPTVPGVSDALLVCQRTVGFELNKRSLVAAANLSDNHVLSMSWVSLGWSVNNLHDALPGIVLAFDAAIDAWKTDCAVYDRVQIEVWDRREDRQVRRVSVEAMVDDLLKWRDGELGDQALLQRLYIAVEE